jgi:subtilisin family serine protease
MAPDAELYDFRVFGATGTLGVTAAIAQSIYDAVDKEGCHVINMSLGGPAPSPSIQKAVQYAHSKGVILVCAAGNSGDNDILTNEISYPATFPECMSIAAVQKQKGLPVAVFSNSNAAVDYAGIGVDVVSCKPGGGYQVMSGTSMACPHVAGLVACLLSNGRFVNKGKNTDTLLRNSLNDVYVIDIDVVGKDNNTGLGFLTALEKDSFHKAIGELGTSMAVIH